MGKLHEFLTEYKQLGPAPGKLLGLLNVLIGRRLQKADGTLISAGVTWRELAFLLKKLRWDRETVRELGLDPATLPPRDRQRFWYAVISQADVDSDKATEAGDRLAQFLQSKGYLVGPAPARKA